MINATSEELESILEIVEKALLAHTKWREDLLRTLVCKLPRPVLYVAKDAHHRCAFGRWFYSKGNSHLLELPTFNTIEELHKAMHDSAREVCLKVEGTGMAPVEDYDYFIRSASGFNDELVGLQQRVLYTLKNVAPQ